MSVQWTLMAIFLYIEVAVIFLFLLTLNKPHYWRSFFNWRIVKFLAAQSSLILYAIIAISVLFFVESIREFTKFSAKIHSPERMGGAAYFEDQMRLFRGQRNFYISGFALFCLFIIKRLAGLMSRTAANHEHAN